MSAVREGAHNPAQTGSPGQGRKSSSPDGSSREMDYGDGALTIQPPEAESTLAPPPDGGLRAWLIVLACTVINICDTVILLMVGMAAGDMGQDLDKTEESTDYYQKYAEMRFLFAPLAAIVMIVFGYRVTAISGAVMVALGFFIASFLDKDVFKLIGFFVVGIAGIGASFAKLASLVPILEYFEKKRLRALIAYYVGPLLISLLMIGILFIPNIEFDWKKIYRAVLAPATAVAIAGATLIDLKLTIKDAPGQTWVAKSLGCFDLRLLKNLLLYLVLGAFFVYELGMSLPNDKIPSISSEKEFPLKRALAYAFLTAIGGLIGELCALLLPKVTKTLETSSLLFILMLTAGVSAGIGFITLIVTPIDAYGFYVLYALIFGFFYTFVQTVRDESVPRVFGRDNVRMVEGLLGLAVGIAGLIAAEIAEAISEVGKGKWKNVFYLGGSFLLVSCGLSACCVYWLKYKYKPQSASPRPTADQTPKEA